MIIYPPSNPVAFYFLNMPVRWYGIILASAIFFGLMLCFYLIKKFKSEVDLDTFSDLSPIVIFTSIIGARLFYVLGDISYYSKNLNEIIMINHGGISIYGAIVFGIITIFIYSRRKKINMLSYCDIIACVLPICQSIGRWGNFINQEAYGSPYDGFLKMYIDREFRYGKYIDQQYYHPTFLYESILDFMLFLILLFVFIKLKNIKTGTIFILYLLLYSIIRIIVELYRIDSVCYFLNIPIAIWISALIFIFTTLFAIIFFKKA